MYSHPFGISIVLAISLALIVVGAVLVKRGLWPRRRGDQPYCRPCGYLLIGIESERCPECGVLLSPLNIVRGRRQRRPGIACMGVILLLPGLGIMGSWAADELDDIPWYHFKPTFLVMRDLRSGSALAGDAINELDRREKAGDLPSKYEQQIFEMALAQQATAASGAVTVGLIQFLQQQYPAGHMTAAQKTRFGQQSFDLRLRVRPIVVLGDRVPYQIDESSRICEPGFIVQFEDRGDEVCIDGKKIGSAGGMGGSMMGGLGAGGSSGSMIECPGVGRHQLQIMARVQLRQGDFATSKLLFQQDRRLTADFEVVATPPPGYFKLISDPKLGNLIKASMVPVRFALTIREPRSLTGDLRIAAMPASIAFDVFARFNDREFKLGVITCNKGSNTNWRISSALPAASVSTPPAAFDLILRSDEKVGRETTDQNDIWAGELIYPNLPVVVDQPK